MKDAILHQFGGLLGATVMGIAGWIGMGMAQVTAVPELAFEKMGALGVLALFGWLGFQFITKTISDNTKAVTEGLQDVTKTMNANHREFMDKIDHNRCKAHELAGKDK